MNVVEERGGPSSRYHVMKHWQPGNLNVSPILCLIDHVDSRPSELDMLLSPARDLREIHHQNLSGLAVGAHHKSLVTPNQFLYHGGINYRLSHPPCLHTQLPLTTFLGLSNPCNPTTRLPVSDPQPANFALLCTHSNLRDSNKQLTY